MSNKSGNVSDSQILLEFDNQDNEDNIINQNDHNNYKGIYFETKTEQQYYEAGAHFTYNDLCSRLEKIKIENSPQDRKAKETFNIDSEFKSKIDIGLKINRANTGSKEKKDNKDISRNKQQNATLMNNFSFKNTVLLTKNNQKVTTKLYQPNSSVSNVVNKIKSTSVSDKKEKIKTSATLDDRKPNQKPITSNLSNLKNINGIKILSKNNQQNLKSNNASNDKNVKINIKYNELNDDSSKVKDNKDSYSITSKDPSLIANIKK